jgi:anti-sigma regulatory factor (Ser/Thr protein kinase)
LVFEEIVGNIVRHGTPQGGNLCIDVSVDIGADRIVMTFEDSGIPFDPCGRKAAAVPRTLARAPDPAQAPDPARAPDGGFGLNLVRSVASSMRYERAADRNRLVVTLPAHVTNR